METTIERTTGAHQQRPTRKRRLLDLFINVISHSRFGPLESFRAWPVGEATQSIRFSRWDHRPATASTPGDTSNTRLN